MELIDGSMHYDTTGIIGVLSKPEEFLTRFSVFDEEFT